MSLASKVASEMRHVPFEDILSWRYLMSEFNPGPRVFIYLCTCATMLLVNLFRSNNGDS